MKDQVDSWFADGVPEDEIRRRLEARAIDDDHLGVRAFFGFNRKLVRMPAGAALKALAKHYASKIGKKSMRDQIAKWSHDLKLDQWLADFVIAWHKTGEPPAMWKGMFGGVTDFTLGPDSIRLVSVVAGPASDPEFLAREFLDRCALVFPPETWQQKRFAERDARRFRLFAEGMTDFQAAKAELEEEHFDLVAVDKREYNREVEARANSVLQSRKRWMAYVTEIVDSVSPSSA